MGPLVTSHHAGGQVGWFTPTNESNFVSSDLDCFGGKAVGAVASRQEGVGWVGLSGWTPVSPTSKSNIQSWIWPLTYAPAYGQGRDQGQGQGRGQTRRRVLISLDQYVNM